MMKCKWAGDVADEYCKNCNGVTMEIDGKSISCEECAGYEAGNEDAGEFMNVPDIPVDVDMTPTDADKQVVEEVAENLNKESKNNTSTKDVEKTDEKTTKSKKINNNTSATKATKTEDKNKATINKNEISKVSEEHNCIENVSEDGIRVTSIRYTSGATVKKGDNYFKFIAEEEWDVSRIEDVQEAREKLWAKLNAEVDSQIEELNNMN